MNSIHLSKISRNIFMAALGLGAFGTVSMGCLPTGTSGLARYNSASYSPNTNSTGFTGTWVITLNNELSPPYLGGDKQLYQRNLVRIKPVAGASDTYEFTYCSSNDSATRTIVAASGNTITLPLEDGSLADYTVTANGRLKTTTTLYGGTATLRAVRLSGNADFSAGTVGFDIATDSAGILRRPTTCFGEYQEVSPMAAIGNAYALSAVGESEGSHIAAELVESYIQGYRVSASDGVNGIDGSIGNNALVSDTSGLRGRVTTPGNSDPYPTAGGTLVMDVKL